MQRRSWPRSAHLADSRGVRRSVHYVNPPSTYGRRPHNLVPGFRLRLSPMDEIGMQPRPPPLAAPRELERLADSLAAAQVYDLAQPLEATTPVIPHHAPFQMGLLRRHGDFVRPGGLSGANELLSLGGHTGTHIDALCHMAVNGRLHGGADAAESCAGGRFRVLGVETIGPILCRGVLLDVPGALGVPALEPGRPIRAGDLERTARA